MIGHFETLLEGIRSDDRRALAYVAPAGARSLDDRRQTIVGQPGQRAPRILVCFQLRFRGFERLLREAEALVACVSNRDEPSNAFFQIAAPGPTRWPDRHLEYGSAAGSPQAH